MPKLQRRFSSSVVPLRCPKTVTGIPWNRAMPHKMAASSLHCRSPHCSKKSVNRLSMISPICGRSGRRARKTLSSGVSDVQRCKSMFSCAESSASSAAWVVVFAISASSVLLHNASICASSGSSCCKTSLIICISSPVYGAAKSASKPLLIQCAAQPDPQSRVPAGTHCAGNHRAAFLRWSVQSHAARQTRSAHPVRPA